ncbi:MAG: NlpC/P60 family protein [Alsobacter sp.]
MSNAEATMSERIVTEARSWIGTPYCHAASVKGVGCDCLGLARGVWRAVVGPEPEEPGPYSADWAEAGGEERLLLAARRHLAPVALDEASAGDLLLFRWREGSPAKHLGICSGPGRMIHAHDGAAVAEVAFGVWRRRLAYAFRFPDSHP